MRVVAFCRLQTVNLSKTFCFSESTVRSIYQIDFSTMSHPRHRIILRDADYYTINDPSNKSKPYNNTRSLPLLARGVEDFTNDFHKSVSKNFTENFISSALSAHVVLSMSYYGAKGKTAEEMKDVLHLPKTNGLSSFKNLLKTMNNVGHIKLGIVNKILTDKNIVVKNDYKKIVSSFFYSEIEEVDFAKDSKKIVKDVNNWCAQKTNNKIKELMTPDDIPATTKLILLNAVYFKGSWTDKFGSWSTAPKPFHVNKSTTINVPTMHKTKTFYYKELKAVDAECIALPYENNDFLFVIIKPNKIDGLEIIEKNIEKVDLNYQVDFKYYSYNMSHNYIIKLALPKFKTESTIDLKINLQELGMTTMFEGGKANFSGISNKPALAPSLYVDKVLQKAFIEVNEEGTEAAAVTYERQVGGGCGPFEPPKVHDFKVDRPFLYRIVHKSTNVTLFSGRVVRPMYP